MSLTLPIASQNISGNLLHVLTYLATFTSQVVSTEPLKAGAWRTCICTGSTFTVSWWWSALHPVTSSTSGTRRRVRMSSLQTSTRCACRQKPWARPRTGSLGSWSSDARLSFIWRPWSRKTISHDCTAEKSRRMELQQKLADDVWAHKLWFTLNPQLQTRIVTNVNVKINVNGFCYFYIVLNIYLCPLKSKQSRCYIFAYIH